MTYDASKHERRSHRLSSHDYTQSGACFVTICAAGYRPLFGKVRADHMVLSAFGQIVQAEWLVSSSIRREIQLDAFVVMPNHIHGIVWIAGHGGSGPERADGNTHPPAPITGGLVGPGPSSGQPPPRAHKSLGSFVAGQKSAVTCRVNTVRNTPGAPVWQRNYYDHIVRDDRDLNRIREYIVSNPARWAEDWHFDRGAKPLWSL